MLSETEPVECAECGWTGKYTRRDSESKKTVGDAIANSCPKCDGVVVLTDTKENSDR